MTEIQYRPEGGATLDPVSESNRFPVALPEADCPLVFRKFQISRTTGNTAYTANDAFGEAFQITDAVKPGRASIIRAIHIIDLTGQKAAVNVHLFDLPITGTADNSAFAVSDVDFANSLGYRAIAAADYSDSSAAAVGTALLEWPVRSRQGTHVYGQLETTGTPTMAVANNDLFLLVAIEYR